MLDEARQIGIDSQDGALALAQATEKHRAVQSAIEDYRTALARFYRVVADRKLPED